MAGWHLSEQARKGRRRRRGRRLRSRATGHRGAAVRAGHELRRQGVSYAQAIEQLAALPHIEEAEQIDPLETVQVPTPAVAMLDELASQQAAQHPIEGDGRIGTLHHLLALLMVPREAASRLLRELGVEYEVVVRRITEEGARRVEGEDWRPEEHRLEGWEEFRVLHRLLGHAS
jgi:hypothetical protein